MKRKGKHRQVASLLFTTVAFTSGCGWQGVNSIPLPGTAGNGPTAYEIQAQLPDVTNIKPNYRVRVGDVTVGSITKVELQDWHALVTMRINGDVMLPANAIATVGQTSLLGTMYIELGQPTDALPQGRLQNGSLIPLSHAGAYPTTEQVLSVASMFLNGGALGRVQDITSALNRAFSGREFDFRGLVEQLNDFIDHLNHQKDDIITTTSSLNTLVKQIADQKPMVDKALRTIPDALASLSQRRSNLAEALDQVGKFSALAADSVDNTKQSLIREFQAAGPVLESLANSGPALTRSLSMLATFPWPKETITKWFRGDAANITMILDLTLSRLDSSLFTGTRWEGNLTQLEVQWGRTIGQLPSPATTANPLVVPYHKDEGP